MLMVRHWNKTLVKKWTAEHGGVVEAAKLIRTALECSKSKAQKIAGARYPSELTAAEQKALAKLWKVPRDVAFEPGDTGQSKHAS